jgi:hypothetical protein
MRPYILLATFSAVAAAQAPAWVHSTKDDPLHGISLEVFVLEGKYLTPPTRGATTTPEMVLRCSAGKLKDGYIAVGAVVETGAHGAPVEMRLDGRFSRAFWNVGNDGTAVFMDPKMDFDRIVWGTWLPHKRGKGDFVKHEIVGVTEVYGGSIVMQFEMPDDQEEMLNACTHVRNHRRFAF